MTTPMTSETFIRLLDTRLREVSENAWDELPSMRDQLYRVIESDSAWEEFFSVSGISDIPAFNGQLEYKQMYPGYITRIEPKEYAAGLAFERKLLDDKKYSVMTDAVESLTIAAKRTQGKIEVDPFAYAFSSAFTFMYSEEGVALCSDSHTTKTGVSTASGFDNAGSSALSKTAVDATRIAMLRLKNDIGERVVINPDTIVCGQSLADTALEIVGTPSGYETAASTKNMDYGRYKVLVLPRLDDYDTNDWFMVDSKQMKKHLLWINRIPKETKMTIDFETFMIKFSIYFRCGNGFKDWRWIYGHQVS